MARFNEILTGRHNKMLTRLFSMKGAAPAPQLAGEIMPVHPFFSGVENRFLETWNRFGTFTNLGPTALQTESGQLKNPAGSNVIAAIEGILVGTLQTDQFIVSSNHANQANLVNVLVGILLDPRAGGPGQVASVCVPSFSAGGSTDLGFGIFRFLIPANQSLQLMNNENQEMLLLPGDTIRVRQLTANQTAFVNFLWRERQIEESELRQ